MRDAATVLEIIRELPRLPREHPLQRMLNTAITISTGEPDATETGTSGLGGGPSEKDQPNWHLVGGLPYEHVRFGRGSSGRVQLR